jgi:DNA-binding transcriptional regulator YiaG
MPPVSTIKIVGRNKMKNPTPLEIKKLRQKHHLTRQQLAQIVLKTERAVASWERGERNMPQGSWELALINLEKKPN